jgi:hypothetical protein
MIYLYLSIPILGFVISFLLGSKIRYSLKPGSPYRFFAYFAYGCSFYCLFEFIIACSPEFLPLLYLQALWPFLPAVFLLFILRITYGWNRHNAWLRGIILAIPVPLSILMVEYISKNPLINYAGFYFPRSPVNPISIYTLGPLWASLVYLTAAVILCIYMLKNRQAKTKRIVRYFFTMLVVSNTINLLLVVLIFNRHTELPESNSLIYLIFSLLIFAGIHLADLFELPAETTVKTMFGLVTDLVFVTDAEGMVVDTNHSGREFVNTSANPTTNIFPNTSVPGVRLLDVLPQLKTYGDDGPVALTDSHGRGGWYTVAVAELRDKAGRSAGELFIAHDITRLMNKTADLERLLDHNQVLLSEVQHRVGNNLQTIASLVRIVSETPDADAAVPVLTRLECHIDSVILAYEVGMETDNATSIDLFRYFYALIEIIESRRYRLDSKHEIQNMSERIGHTVIDPSLRGMQVSMQELMPLALLITELCMHRSGVGKIDTPTSNNIRITGEFHDLSSTAAVLIQNLQVRKDEEKIVIMLAPASLPGRSAV